MEQTEGSKMRWKWLPPPAPNLQTLVLSYHLLHMANTLLL